MFETDVSETPAFYPEYLTDLQALYCPEAKAGIPEELTFEIAVDDHSYFYLGYAIGNQEQLQAFAGAYKATVSAGGHFEGDLVGAIVNGTALRRLRLSTDIGASGSEQAVKNSYSVPVFIERPFAHKPGGSNVLYADGHVEFIKHGSKWPVTDDAMNILLQLDALGAP